MQYLGLALYAEGSTDYYFLRPLLQRLCEDLCVREARDLVDVGEVLALDHPPERNRDPREDRILAAAKLARGAWHILFIHADGSNDHQHARQHQVAPCLGILRNEFDGDGLGVAVVPVRETEAWAIVDGDALRAAFGTTLNSQELGLPNVQSVEHNADPKACLTAAFEATGPSGKRRKQGTSPYLSMLGESISLDRLRRLAAFNALEDELREALRQLQIIR